MKGRSLLYLNIDAIRYLMKKALFYAIFIV